MSLCRRWAGILLGGALLTLATTTHADGTQAQESGFNDWLRQHRQEYASYRDAQDAAFAHYLHENWQAFQAYKAERRDPQPKPAVQPALREAGSGKAPPVSDPIHETTSHALWGIEIRWPACVIPPVTAASFEPNALADTWAALNAAVCPALVANLQQTVNDHHLGDLGRWRLAFVAARHYLKSESTQDVTLMAWVLMSKLGLDSRLGYNDSGVQLLVPVRESLFGVPWYELEGKRYYQLGNPLEQNAPDVARLYIHAKGHEAVSQGLSFSLSEAPRLPHKWQNRRVEFIWQGQPVSLELPWDMSQARWYEGVPLMSLQEYFTAGVDKEWLLQLARALAPHTAPLEGRDATEFLLAMIQQGISYQTDDAQFGHENYVLPAQLLAYPAGDCEDRAFFLALIVRKVLGLSVVGLDWPGHVAVAVVLPGQTAMPKRGELTKWTFKGEDWWVADPTYLGAHVGEAMPQYRGKQPSFIMTSRP